MFLYIICFTYEYLILVIFYTFKGGVTLSGWPDTGKVVTLVSVILLL